MKQITRFASVVFLQGEAAQTALQLLERQRIATALDYLREHEDGDELPSADELEATQPWGTGDMLFRRADYVIAANQRLQYVSLSRRCPLTT